MPTDGADFGRKKHCYGKAYTMARDGADDFSVAEYVMRGVEVDIKRDGGVPAFPIAVSLLQSAHGMTDRQYLSAVDQLRSQFSESSLTRDIASEIERVGLGAISRGNTFTREEAAGVILMGIGNSRSCDGMSGYIARNRTHDLSQSNAIVTSIKGSLKSTPSLQSLIPRMLNCSAKGLPAKQQKTAQVDHTATGMDEELY